MTEPPDLRCSVITHELGERPAGSAGGAERYLLVELPLPWPKKIDAHALLTEVVTPPDAVSTTLLGIRSTDSMELGSHRIICYERRRPFDGFERTEAVLPTEELAPTISSLMASGPASFDPQRVVEAPPATQDLLLCTHGTRDRCCGQFGTLLHIELDGTLPPNVRMWRTSHTGGHRFAPTGIHFPSGTAWAYLDADLTRGIVNRSIDTADLLPHFRGNVGVSGRPAQIAEGLAFLDSGWNWLETARTVSVDQSREGEAVATVASFDYTTTVTMVEEDPVPVPLCGEGTETAVKFTPQLLVTDRS